MTGSRGTIGRVGVNRNDDHGTDRRIRCHRHRLHRQSSHRDLSPTPGEPVQLLKFKRHFIRCKITSYTIYMAHA